MEGVDLAQRRLVVAANRGPVSFHDDPSGEPVVTRGPGGLVTVLTEVLRHHPGTWVAAALSDAERRLAAENSAVEVALDGEEYRVRYVAPSPDAYHKYYNVVSNPMLWFIQHYLWDLGRHPDIRAEEMDAWHNGYLVVNEQFARAVVDEVRRGPDGRRRRGPAGDGGDALVLLHDYQLYCVAPDVRAACPGAFLHQFVHIPWPQSDYWRVLPTHIREAVFRGLLGNDVVAFHTRHYVRNFLRCCADLLDLEVDETRCVVRHEGREVWVRAYPVSIDPASLRAAAGSRRARTAERKLRGRRREFLLLRVDRLDLSKNIIRGFVALDRFLELHPEFKERFTFLALLQPSREDVEEYVTYRERVERLVADVNTRHGTTDWMPIDLRIQDDFPDHAGRLRAVRRPARQRHRRRDEPGRQGGSDPQPPRRRAGPERVRGGLRGAGRLRPRREPVQHRGPGRGDPPGARHAARRARVAGGHAAPRRRGEQRREVGAGAVRRHRREAGRRRLDAGHGAAASPAGSMHGMRIDVMGLPGRPQPRSRPRLREALGAARPGRRRHRAADQDPGPMIARGVRQAAGAA